jgi:hypothetical protein
MTLLLGTLCSTLLLLLLQLLHLPQLLQLPLLLLQLFSSLAR